MRVLKTQPGLLIAARFESFEEFSDTAVGWDADFRQLDSEAFKPELIQLMASSILVSRGRFGCHVSQFGQTPANMRTFAIPEKDCTAFRWFGHMVDQRALLVFPADRSIDSQSRPGFHVTTFSIPEDRLSGFLELNGLASLNKKFSRSEHVIKGTIPLLDRLRRQLAGLQDAVTDPDTSYLHPRLNELEEAILWTLYEILSQRETPPGIRSQVNFRKLGAVLEYVRRHPRKPIQISELSSLIGVSERTLLNKFRRETGMTPKEYLKGLRLSGVHAELWHADPIQEKVATIANRWGFVHLSQFALDYKRIYGELPSETLKNPPH